jgi:uncharacterized membrane protein
MMPKRGFFLKNTGRYLMAALFVGAGVMHFVSPKVYVRIVPPVFPFPEVLVAVSGAAEIAGGFGLLVSRVRRSAAYGLVALLIAVFPANIYMAMDGLMLPAWILWARLPLQLVLIWLVLKVR